MGAGQFYRKWNLMKNQTGINRDNLSVAEDLLPEASTMDLVDMAYLLADMFGRPGELSAEQAEPILAYCARHESLNECEANPELAEFVSLWFADIVLLAQGDNTLSLEESVYKPWTTRHNHPLKGVTGLSYGDSAAHMEKVLSSFGMSLDHRYGLTPDSLSTLLEFLGFLLENRPVNEVVTFCRDHLDWLENLREKAIEKNAGRALMSAISAAIFLVEDVVFKMEF